MNDALPAIEPKYTTNQPNDPIVIYSGPLELTKDADAWTGPGTVELRWGIKPHFSFRITNVQMQAGKKWPWHSARVRIAQWDAIVNVEMLSARDEGNSWTLGGHFTEPIEAGTGKKLQSISFHLINFPYTVGEMIFGYVNVATAEKGPPERSVWHGRLVFEAIGWKAIIDSVIPTKTKRYGEGYIVTHIGKLERSDGALFSKTDPRDFLKHLETFLSFIRGGAVSFPLLEGHGANGSIDWRKFDASGIGTHRHPRTWFPNQESREVPKAFSNFVALVQLPPWNNSFDRLLNWYIESVGQTRRESAVILAQVALESLAWVYCTEVNRVISSDGFDNLTASDKFRLVLSLHGIPLEIPPHFEALAKAIDDKNKAQKSPKMRQGPDGVTKIRNSLAHGDAIAPDAAKLEQASRLALWYLELLLLRTIKYEGIYANVVAPDGERQYYHLPWSSRGNTEFVPD